MALKRVLPSRLTGAKLPESASAPTEASVKNVSIVVEAEKSAVSLPVAEPVAPPQSTVPQSPETTASALSAVAASAFSTLPPAQPEATAPARVLEESFAPAPGAPGNIAPAQQEVVVPQSASQPVQEITPEPVSVAVPEEVFQPVSLQEAAPSTEPSTRKEEAQIATSQVEGPQSSLQEEVKPEVVLQLGSQEEPQPVSPFAQFSQPEEQSEPAPVPAEEEQIPQGPTNFLAPSEGGSNASFTPSRPDDNPLKRRVGRRSGRGRSDVTEAAPVGPETTAPKAETQQVQKPAESMAEAVAVPAAPEITAAAPQPGVQSGGEAPSGRSSRVKRERDFAAATVEAPKEDVPEAKSEDAGLAPHVPVEGRPLSRVDEGLIEAGIIKGPPADSLTQSVPGAVAVTEMAEFDADFQEEPLALTPQQEISPPATGAQAVAAPAAAPQAGAAGYVSAAMKNARDEDLPEDGTQGAGLPWANPETAGASGAWEVEIPAAGASPADGNMPASQSIDFYKPMSPAQPGGTPPWAGSVGGRDMPPPEIMGQKKPAGASAFPVWGMALGLVAVGVIGFIAWNGNKQTDLQNQVARWTGGLTKQSDTGTGAESQTGNPAGSFSMAEIGSNKGVLQPPLNQQASSTAQIDFTDVPADQAKGPIVADGSEKMPDDINMMAKWQQAVARARAEKTGDASGTVPALQVATADAKTDEKLTPGALKAELESYRRTLAEGGPVSPEQARAQQAAAEQQKLSVNKDPDSYMDGQPLVADQAALLPPPNGTGAQGSTSNILPPPELYTKNPQNLPIVAEPRASKTPTVRTLSDFEAEPFEPEREKVRIPRGLKPRMAATDFPSLEVLSFVPRRGIIAYADGREGVLLLGESISGWELTNVTNDMAEFRAGRKSHYVTAEN